jgi:hypothetical protein
VPGAAFAGLQADARSLASLRSKSHLLCGPVKFTFRLQAAARFIIYSPTNPHRYTIGAIAHSMRSSLPKRWESVRPTPWTMIGRSPILSAESAQFHGSPCRQRGTWHIKRASVCRLQCFFWPVSELAFLGLPRALRILRQTIPCRTKPLRTILQRTVPHRIGPRPHRGRYRVLPATGALLPR